jgi:hypothetical protein
LHCKYICEKFQPPAILFLWKFNLQYR